MPEPASPTELHWRQPASCNPRTHPSGLRSFRPTSIPAADRLRIGKRKLPASTRLRWLRACQRQRAFAFGHFSVVGQYSFRRNDEPPILDLSLSCASWMELFSTIPSVETVLAK